MCIYLILGVMLFGLIHLYPAAFTGSHKALIGKIGEKPYKGMFSLCLLLSLSMIVFGWRLTDAVTIYTPPEWGNMAALIFMYPALFLFISARAGSNIKRFIRHPQLYSVVIFSLSHLSVKGDSRTLVLFGMLAVWAIIQIFLLNRRDGGWQKPSVLPLSRDIKVGIIAVVVYAGLAYGHGYISGVSLI